MGKKKKIRSLVSKILKKKIKKGKYKDAKALILKIRIENKKIIVNIGSDKLPGSISYEKKYDDPNFPRCRKCRDKNAFYTFDEEIRLFRCDYCQQKYQFLNSTTLLPVKLETSQIGDVSKTLKKDIDEKSIETPEKILELLSKASEIGCGTEDEPFDDLNMNVITAGDINALNKLGDSLMNLVSDELKKFGNPRILYRLGRLLAKMGNCKGAINVYHASIVLDPSYVYAWNNYATCFMETKQYSEALDAVNKAISIDRNHAKCWHNRGSINFDLGKTDEAIIDLKQSIQLKPSWKSYLMLGYALFKKNDIDGEICSFESALSLKKGDIGIILRLCDAYRSGEEIQKALVLCRDTLENHPNEPVLHAMLAILLGESGDERGMMSSFQIVEKSDLKDVYYLNQLANCLQEKKHYEEAVTTYERILILESNNIYALNGLGVCYFHTKPINTQKARKLFRKGMRIVKNLGNSKESEAIFLYNIACSYGIDIKHNVPEKFPGEHLGNAIKNLEKSIRLDSKYRDTASKDEDFDSIKNDPKFVRLIGIIDQKSSKIN